MTKAVELQEQQKERKKEENNYVKIKKICNRKSIDINIGKYRITSNNTCKNGIVTINGKQLKEEYIVNKWT